MGNPRSASENEKLKFRRPKGITNLCTLLPMVKVSLIRFQLVLM